MTEVATLGTVYVMIGAMIGLGLQPWVRKRNKWAWSGLGLGFGAVGILLLLTSF